MSPSNLSHVLVAFFLIPQGIFAMRPWNFVANFGASPAPFTIKVDDDFIALTKQKVVSSRMAEDMGQYELTDGPPTHNATTVKDFWIKSYNWNLVQDRLNTRLNQFTTTVKLPSNDSYMEPVPLHFVHHISACEDAIPLLFIHGWPGSFIEVQNVIHNLTSPLESTDPAFHVVAPSVPGFGFSPAPSKPGFGYIAAAHTFDALMKQLGYAKYVIQGGDLGGLVLRHQAHLYPSSVVACHSNFWVVPPNATDLQRYQNNETTEDEAATIQTYQGFINTSWSYAQIQQTTPLRLAFGMTDSPIGLAMWIYDGMLAGVVDPGFWSPEDIITWTMMLWIQGPYGASRIYKEAAKEGSLTLDGLGTFPFVKQPMAISEFVHDIWYRTPLDWAQRLGNVKYRIVHKTGGHFPATETPDLLVGDIRAFFGNRELSNTVVFERKA